MMFDADLYYSLKLRRNLADASTRVPPGAAHYSYSSVADKFIDLLRARGQLPYELDRPEIYVTPPLGQKRRAIHLMFKPYEEFRLLNEAINIAHVAWEFEDLPRRECWLLGDPRRRDPFADYLHMLRIPDRIWVGCSHTKAVFAKFGLENVDIVPAPLDVLPAAAGNLPAVRQRAALIARRHLAGISAVRFNERVMRNPEALVVRESTVKVSTIMQPDKTVFLLVANPGDLRKNLPALIDGFSRAAQADPSLVLIVKLVIDNQHVTLRDVISRVLPVSYENEEMCLGDIAPTNIFFVHEFLSVNELNALYCCADFYLTATVAEGQNLPLQEAMAFGTIPVAAAHTAMADYVTPDNGVPINWVPRPATLAFEQAYGLRNFQVAHVAAAAVTDAVQSASLIAPDALHRKQTAAWQTIHDNYSHAAVAACIDAATEGL